MRTTWSSHNPANADVDRRYAVLADDGPHA